MSRARTGIAYEVPMTDVAMQVAGLGDGNTLVLLLNEIASVVDHHYVRDRREKKHEVKKSVEAFLSRADNDELSDEAVCLLTMLVEHDKKKKEDE